MMRKDLVNAPEDERDSTSDKRPDNDAGHDQQRGGDSQRGNDNAKNFQNESNSKCKAESCFVSQHACQHWADRCRAAFSKQLTSR